VLLYVGDCDLIPWQVEECSMIKYAVPFSFGSLTSVSEMGDTNPIGRGLWVRSDLVHIRL
jgi:hypothetical protein